MVNEIEKAAKSVSEIKREVREIKNLISEIKNDSEIAKANDDMHQMIGTMANVVSLVNGGVAAYDGYKKAAAGVAGAQALLNTTMSASTFGLVAAGVAAAGAAVYGLYKAVTVETEAERVHRLAVEENQKAIKERTKALEESKEAFTEEILSSKASYDNTKDLADELFKLVDVNGKVSDANKKRADFILGELNEALNTEYTLIDLQKGKNDELRESIYNLIDAKKAEAYMNAYQEDYEEALKKQASDLEALTKAKAEHNDLLLEEVEYKKNVAAAQEKVNELEAIINDSNTSETDRAIATTDLRTAYKDLAFYQDNLDRLYSTNAEAFEEIANAEKNVQNTSAIISIYKESWNKMADGDIDGVIQSFENLSLQLSDSELASQQFAEGTTEHLGLLGGKCQNALSGLLSSLEVYAAAPSEASARAVKDSIAVWNDAKSDYIAAGGSMKDGVIIGWNGSEFGVEQDMSVMLAELGAYGTELQNVGKTLGEDFDGGFVNELTSLTWEPIVQEKTDDLEGGLKGANDDAKDLAKTLDDLPKDMEINVKVNVSYEEDIPKNARGTQFARKGLSVINEEGIELIEGKDGSFRYVDSDSASLTYLNWGDKVYTAQQTESMMKNDVVSVPRFAKGLNNHSTKNLNAEVMVNLEAESIGIGKAIAQGVAQGIEKEESEVEKVFEELAETTAKSAFERKLQFAQSTEEIMKIKQQEVNGLLDSEKEYLAEKRRIELEQEEEEYREKLENAKDEEARQKIRYEREKELQKREQEAYLEILKEGADAEKKILDGVTKELEKKKDRFIDGLEEIKDAQENFYNSLDSGGFLETVTTTLGDEEYDVEGLRDWELENKALKNYSELLDKVSERLKEGFGEDTQGYDEFMDELRKNHKGDGGKFLAYLDMADDGELLRYIEGYQENKALREGISKDSFSEEQAQLIEEFTRDWGTVPEEFFDIGEESAKEYVQGFKNKMHELVDMAREEIESSFELSFILPQVAMLFSGLGASSNVVNYNSTYNVASAEGESTRKQIEAIRNAEIYDKMSKGYRV